jgi:mannonate dehydratase
MQLTWRWYGPKDKVTLRDARQAGATGIVSALHHLPPGELWSIAEIERHKALIEAAGMTWSVVESVNVSEDIKKRSGAWQRHIANYQQSLRNLGACGIRTVCYNFMPVIDWMRTDLAYELADGAQAMRFDADVFAAFDLYVLERPAAKNEWSEERQRSARARFENMAPGERERMMGVILAGLPGSDEPFTIEYVRRALAEYDGCGEAMLRENYGEFLRAVCPVAEEAGVRLCVHPDDPPRPLLGLPRIVSKAGDFEALLKLNSSPANGITFCTGSLGVRADNDLPAMARRFGPRIYFAHPRTTQREADPESFHEAPHLEGDVDIFAVMKELVLEEHRRKAEGRNDEIPIRADHGNRIISDLEKPSVPGYPAVGRLKGLAELRGILTALERML